MSQLNLTTPKNTYQHAVNKGKLRAIIGKSEVNARFANLTEFTGSLLFRDLHLERVRGYVLRRPVSYVLDPLGGIVTPIFVPTIPYRHAYSLEVG